jgi:hypothetical protein
LKKRGLDKFTGLVYNLRQSPRSKRNRKIQDFERRVAGKHVCDEEIANTSFHPAVPPNEFQEEVNHGH